MQLQGAATPGSTHRVSVGCAPSLRLPRQPHTAPLRRLPPAPLPSALRLKIIIIMMSSAKIRANCNNGFVRHVQMNPVYLTTV